MRQERVYRAEAVVVREMDYGEADRILTLVGPQGKFGALAKGIRRPSSRKVGHLQLFCRVQLVLAKGRNLDIITQAECLEEFAGIRSDLVRFGHACYAAELVERFSQEGEENPVLYELLVQALRWFAEGQDLRLWARYLDLRLLSCGGFEPELQRCQNCHGVINPEVNYLYAAQGGLLCGRCGSLFPQAKAISVNAQKVLRYLQKQGMEQVAVLRVSAATHNELESLLHGYLEYVLERELKTTTFLQRVRKEISPI